MRATSAASTTAIAGAWALDRGETGTYAERRFVPADAVGAAFRGVHHVSAARFQSDVDPMLDHVSEPRLVRGLVDMCVIVDRPSVDPQQFPQELVMWALTLADLAAGPHATGNPRRSPEIGWPAVGPVFDPLPIDAAGARAYGPLYAAVVTMGRKTHRARAFDWMMAAKALANQRPLYNSQPGDFHDVTTLVDVRSVSLNMR